MIRLHAVYTAKFLNQEGQSNYMSQCNVRTCPIQELCSRFVLICVLLLLISDQIYHMFQDYLSSNSHSLNTFDEECPSPMYRFLSANQYGVAFVPIAHHRIDSNYFVLVRCHFRISLLPNTNALKCWKHSDGPAKRNLCVLCHIASLNIATLRVGCYCFVSRGHLNIKMLSYQYRDPHVKDKTVSRPSYL